LRGSGESIQSFIADERSIHAVQVLQELLEDVAKPNDNLRESVQEAATTQFFGIVNNGLETKYAFAFGISFQSQQAEMELEDRQAIIRCLDHDF
jgi:hypothetical protein